MNLTEYQKEARRTCPDLEDNEIDNVHMLFGMSTEVGELHDIFKKTIAYKKPLDKAHIKEELGDLMWYIINFCTINNFDLEAILDTNISKLKTRYPDKFTTEAALNRDLDKEDKVLGKK